MQVLRGIFGLYRNIDELIVSLIIRIGDLKQNVKDLAANCIDMLGEEGNTGPALICSLLYRPKGLPKVCEDHKHLVENSLRREEDWRVSLVW